MSGEKFNMEEAHRRWTANGATVLPEPVLKDILRQKGVPIPRGRLCTDAHEAAEYARSLNYPLALKLVSDRLLHKTELGGVRLNIGDERELLSAFTEMDRKFRDEAAPGYQGILVEEQAEKGVEVIIGLQNDAVFGPVIMAGLGGIYTDLFEDVSFRMLPLTRKDAESMIKELKSFTLLDGFRGAPPADVEGLVDAVTAIAGIGAELAPLYRSVDFNPVIVTPRGVTVVDAKLELAEKIDADPFCYEKPRTGLLEYFFKPASVAVMGASSVPGKIGNVIVDSLVNHQFKGKVYPINPNHGEILGAKCYPDLRSLPETPELLVVVVDLGRMPEILDEMNSLGIKNALIVSGGGKELGGEREKLEMEIARRARQYGIRLIGPNCIGSYDGQTRFDSFFHSHERLLRPPAGPMGFITQSGTWGCVFLEKAEITGVSRMVSYGNRVDVDEGDLIAGMAADPGTRVIGSYIEGLSSGRKFIDAAALSIAAGKPVAVFKTGRNKQSAKASMSHTGAYGGSYHVYRGVMEQAGVVLTDSFHELYAACEALALQPPAKGNGAAMLSNGAGPMVNALDLFPGKGLTLPALDRASVKKMADHFSFFYIVENPVDVTGSATAEDYEYVIQTLLDDDNIQIIMPFFVFQDTPLDESIVERLDAVNKLRKKPIVCCAAGGPYNDKMSRALTAIGVPVFPDVVQWVAAASALSQWGKVRGLKSER